MKRSVKQRLGHFCNIYWRIWIITNGDPYDKLRYDVGAGQNGHVREKRGKPERAINIMGIRDTLQMAINAVRTHNSRLNPFKWILPDLHCGTLSTQIKKTTHWKARSVAVRKKILCPYFPRVPRSNLKSWVRCFPQYGPG